MYLYTRLHHQKASACHFPPSSFNCNVKVPEKLLYMSIMWLSCWVVYLSSLYHVRSSMYHVTVMWVAPLGGWEYMSIMWLSCEFYLEHQREVELEWLCVLLFHVVCNPLCHQPSQELMSVQQVLLQSCDNHVSLTRPEHTDIEYSYPTSLHTG